MKFILTGIAETSFSEKTPLYFFDCNSINGAPYTPSSPSWRSAEMAVIPEHRISTCSRTSSVSTDSTRMATSLPQVTSPYSQVSYPQRLSSHSFSDSARQSYHSNSDSSVCSLDINEESGANPSVNVMELYHNGLSESEVVFTWLSGFRYEAYLNKFLDAGYDMPTISRMTPEDLTAIGVVKPGNRKKLTSEISKLAVPDRLRDTIPESVLELLQHLGLDEYNESLIKAKIYTIEDIMKISCEDFEEIGIQKLGHQKKMSLAIERLNRLMKRQSHSGSNHSLPISSVSRWSADMAASGNYLAIKTMSGEDIGYAKDDALDLSFRSNQELNQSRSKGRHLSGEPLGFHNKHGISRSSSGNSVNSSGDYTAPKSQSYGDQDGVAEDSGSSSSGSMQRASGKKGPVRAIHGLTMSKHPSQDSIEQRRNSAEIAPQYATLRRSGSRKQSSPSVEMSQPVYPQSPVNKSPAVPSLPSPFSNFKSPYAQINSGQVKNQLQKENRSSSVPSSPVTNVPNLQNEPMKTRYPPAPPQRTHSLKRGDENSSYDDRREEDEYDNLDFPPPLEPTSFSLEAMKAVQPKNGQLTNALRHSPAREGLRLQNVSESSLAARRKAGSLDRELKSLNNNNSNSAEMTDSLRNSEHSSNADYERNSFNTPRNSIEENIPFANENAGTLKHNMSLRDAIDDNSDIYDIENELECDQNEESGSEDNEFNTVKRNPKPLMASESPKQFSTSITNRQCNGNVLNDIGSMLDCLSTELDAMLEDV